MELFPDLSTLSDYELDSMLGELERDEDAISKRRRLLHGRIDILRGERVARLKARVAEGELSLPAPDALSRPLFDGTGDLPDDVGIEAMPDLATIGDDALRTMILELEHEEDDVSLQRRVLQGRIDILRAERSRRQRGGEWNPDSLAEALTHRAGGATPGAA